MQQEQDTEKTMTEEEKFEKEMEEYYKDFDYFSD